MQNKLKTYC